MLCLFILKSTKNHKTCLGNSVFLFLRGFTIQMKISFMVLEIWLFGLGKVLEIFKGVCTDPEFIVEQCYLMNH